MEENKKSLSNLHVRINTDTKMQAETILSDLDLSLADAVKIFVKQIVLHKGIPFDVCLPTEPNYESLKAMLETERMLNDKNTKYYTIEEFEAELDKIEKESFENDETNL